MTGQFARSNLRSCLFDGFSQFRVYAEMKELEDVLEGARKLDFTKGMVGNIDCCCCALQHSIRLYDRCWHAIIGLVNAEVLERSDIVSLA